MSIATDQFNLLNSLTLESSLALASLSFGGSARVFLRQAEFANGAFQAGGARMSEFLLSDRQMDQGEFSANCHKQLQDLLDLSKDCLEIMLQTQEEIVRSMKNKEEVLIRAIRRPSSNSPGTAAATVNATKVEREAADAGKRRRRL